MTNSNSDSEPDSSCEESEIFPPQARNCGDVGGEMKTKTKGSDDTYVIDDHETSVTGGVYHSHDWEKHHDRVSLLQDIDTTTRMLVNDP